VRITCTGKTSTFKCIHIRTVRLGRRHMKIKRPYSAPGNELNCFAWHFESYWCLSKLYLKDSART